MDILVLDEVLTYLKSFLSKPTVKNSRRIRFVAGFVYVNNPFIWNHPTSRSFIRITVIIASNEAPFFVLLDADVGINEDYTVDVVSVQLGLEMRLSVVTVEVVGIQVFETIDVDYLHI